jgi:hypothetical protein
MVNKVTQYLFNTGQYKAKEANKVTQYLINTGQYKANEEKYSNADAEFPDGFNHEMTQYLINTEAKAKAQAQANAKARASASANANANANANAKATVRSNLAVATLATTLGDASGSIGTASKTTHDNFLSALKGGNTGVEPCRKRSVAKCEAELFEGVRYAPCRLVRTQRATVCEYATMPEGATRKELDKITARLAKQRFTGVGIKKTKVKHRDVDATVARLPTGVSVKRAQGTAENAEVRKAWGQSEFRPVWAQVGMSKLKIDRDTKSTLKRVAGVFTGKGLFETNALTTAKKKTRKHALAIRTTHGPNTEMKVIRSEKLGTLAQNKSASVPTVTEHRLQCAMLSAPSGLRPQAVAVRAQMCVRSGACEARSTNRGGMDCVPSPAYVTGLTKQSQRVKRDKLSKKTDDLGIPKDYPRQSGKLVRYVLSKQDASELRSKDGKRIIAKVGNGLSAVPGVLWGGMGYGYALGARKSANLFGWINDPSEPMSCSQYPKQGRPCPLAPQYPTDKNIQLYSYKSGTQPVLGHCTLYNDRCVGQMGYFGLFRQGTPTYEQLLAETKAHRRRIG